MRLVVAALIISLLILGGCANNPPATPASVQAPAVQPHAEPPAVNIDSPGSKPENTPAPAPVPDPSPVPAPVPEQAPGPSSNEIWVLNNEFIPPVLKVSEGITFSFINKNSYPVTILPSPSGSNAIVYVDPVTNKITVNGANFDNVLPPGGSTSLTLVTGGAFIVYLENNPGVTGMVLVGF